jgi:hypothetical protein
MLRAARAIAIRLRATSSEKPSSQTQKANIEENGQLRWSFRSSISPR